MEEENIIIKEDATDRISELPECIIENILLRLHKPKELVRVSVLSKKWFALTASLPVLKFIFNNFANLEVSVSSRNVRDIFNKYIKHTVSRFCRQQNVKNAHKFKLVTVVANKKELDIIDKCVKLILMRGVKVLDICIRKSRKSRCQPMYLLPDMLSSVSALTSLKISDCVMLPSSLMVDVVNFKSLKKLRLNEVPLNPLVIKHLTATCPLLQELDVECCYGFQNLCVYGQNLKTLRFINYNGKGIEAIDIEAPNLCECHLSVGQGRGATSVILGSCKQLRTLYLDGPFFQTSIGFADFLSNFPFLENLSLRLVNRRNILAVSSPSLRNFVLFDECDLEEIDMNTPNLHLFKYSNSWNCSKGELIIESDSGELKTCMECHIINRNKVDTLWLLKLRRFLEKANIFKILKLGNRYGRLSVDSEVLKVTQLPPCDLEHVELNLPIGHVLPVLDGLLWCFHPRSFSLTSGFSRISDEERNHFLKCISKRLIQQEDQGPTNIRIEWSLPSKAKIYFSWSSVLTALTRYEMTQTVTFRKDPDTDEGQRWRKKYQRQRLKKVQGSLGR